MMYRNSWIPEVFNGLFNEGNMQKANTTAPAINVKESLTKYTVELAAPGMRKDDFEVNLNENGDLHIKMENKHQPEQEQHVYLRRESVMSSSPSFPVLWLLPLNDVLFFFFF